MLVLRLITFSTILLSTLTARDDLFFDRVKLQMFGNIGLTSIGVGGNFSETATWDVFYGYVPKSYGGISINTISGKFSKHFLEVDNKYSLYFGTGVMHVFNQRYRSQFRDKYPTDNYYQVTSTHLTPYLGFDTKTKVYDKDIKLFVEMGTVDVYLANWFKHSSEIGFDDVINFAFGASYDF